MFFVRKGFGFIMPDDGDEEIFVHHSAIKSEGFTTLADGEEVEYEIEEVGGGKARWAANTRLEISNSNFKFPRARNYEVIGLVLGCIEAKFCK